MPTLRFHERLLTEVFGAGPAYQARWDGDVVVVGLWVEAVDAVGDPKREVELSLARDLVDLDPEDPFVFLPLHRRLDPRRDGGIVRLLAAVGIDGGQVDTWLTKVAEGLGPALATVVVAADSPLGAALREAFARVVPELSDGSIRITSIVTEDERAKVAVRSRDRDVDPVGAMIGLGGRRVGEVLRTVPCVLDVVDWTADPTLFLQRALGSTRIRRVSLDGRRATLEGVTHLCSPALLADPVARETALAQNLRLAASLTELALEVQGPVMFEPEA